MGTGLALAADRRIWHDWLRLPWPRRWLRHRLIRGVLPACFMDKGRVAEGRVGSISVMHTTSGIALDGP